ncbi:MAG: hypothetical protein HYV33_00080 [Candidatus Kerfeldbacteria bacterium]|nr:hypothetical protein [Candidatus Kerfeldbacteria bacterium]
MRLSTKNIIFAFGLITFAVVTKLWLIDYANVETLTSSSILAGALLGPYLGLLVGLAAVVGKDMVIGNTTILVYTWSAWAIIGASSAWLQRFSSRSSITDRSIRFTGWSIVTTLFFYGWTNFGVWHIGGLYPHTWAGLLDCYVLAVPFLRNQLLGNLMIVPVVSVVTLTVYQYLPYVKRGLASAFVKVWLWK